MNQKSFKNKYLMTFFCFGCKDVQATMQCPTCQKENPSTPKRESYFCSQECFVKEWSTHKEIHKKRKKEIYNPWPFFRFTGKLRPHPQGPKRFPTDEKLAELASQNSLPDYYKTGEPKGERNPNIPVLSEEEVAGMRLVCRLAREVLDGAGKMARTGATGEMIDAFVFDACMQRNSYPSPLNYRGFPRSCCVSVNEVICHGIPDKRPFKRGDIVNIDITLYHKGFHGDLNESYIALDEGENAETAVVEASTKKLVEIARETLISSIKMVKPGLPYRDLGQTIESLAKGSQFSVVKGFCGHGIGRIFHCAPNVPHYKGNKAVGVMKVGHVFTIEPMINAGMWQDIIWPDDWTAVTVDGKWSAQFEHTLLVTEDGCEVMTSAPGEQKYYVAAE